MRNQKIFKQERQHHMCFKEDDFDSSEDVKDMKEGTQEVGGCFSNSMIRCWAKVRAVEIREDKSSICILVFKRT